MVYISRVQRPDSRRRILQRRQHVVRSQHSPAIMAERSLHPSLGSEVTTTDNDFFVRIDVKHFTPQEITVGARGQSLNIHARHGERQDEHGIISREFTRQYMLPRHVDKSAVTCSVSPDGVLTIKAPKLAQGNGSQERIVPITQETS
ncbi:alpha-crystallin A chain-like [Pomacea canaliculata]|uniref:alpha-crystallin A chain-like n=1 Tax=Pomacea canaliculata TaxID=400727 RepID=UPI000D733AE3|nr:alpha-crystallin A chain-like [Pomacea canaliculata]